MDAFKKLGLPVQLVITVVLMVVVGVVGFKFWPNIEQQRSTIKKKDTELAALNEEIQRGLALEKNLENLKREIRRLEGQLEQLKAIIPPVRDDSKLLQSFESLAKAARMNVNKIVPQRLRQKDFYDEYPLNLDVTGNYHDLARFFDKMRTRSRIFNVSGLKMKAGRRSEHAVAANFTTVTFIYREGATTASSSSASTGKKKGKKGKKGKKE